MGAPLFIRYVGSDSNSFGNSLQSADPLPRTIAMTYASNGIDLTVVKNVHLPIAPNPSVECASGSTRGGGREVNMIS